MLEEDGLIYDQAFPFTFPDHALLDQPLAGPGCSSDKQPWQQPAAMVQPSLAGCDDLSHIPDDLSLCYFPSSLEVSQKAQEKGLNYYQQGYIHNIQIFKETNIVKVTAKCGLVVNSEFAFLGASPDSKVCHDAVCGIIEIKCPFKARNMSVIEAVETLQPDFMLHKIADATIALKQTHQYLVTTMLRYRGS